MITMTYYKNGHQIRMDYSCTKMILTKNNVILQYVHNFSEYLTGAQFYKIICTIRVFGLLC